ncbi:prolyl oligopeptidase family serine peptidase [Thermaurantiacus sp.]
MKFACLAALLLALTVPVAARTPFEAADLYQLQQIENPVLAADGRRVLFTRVRFDEGSDRRQGELWLAHLDASGAIIDQRLLVPASLAPREASFTPDGSRIAFVGQHMGGAQLFVLTLADPVARPATSGETVPMGPVWSPDGRRLAFIGRVPAKAPALVGMPPRAKGADRAPEPKLVTDLFWRTDAGGEVKPGAFHLFVLDLDSGTTTQLTSGPEDMVDPNGLAWTPDGRFLIASRNSDRIKEPTESNLWRFDAGRPGAAPVQLTSRPGSEFAPAVSPDGRTLAFLGAEATRDFYPMPEVWLMPLAPGAPIRKAAPSLDRPVAAAPLWRADSAALHILYHDEGVTRVGEVDAASGAVTVKVPVVGGTRLYLPSAGGQFSAAAGTFAWTTAHADRPAGLGVSKGGEQTGRLDPNARWAEGKRASAIEEVRAKAPDGREIQGWLMFPPGFDRRKRYPLILDIHGGPNTDYGPIFSVTHALYAAAGYLVLFTNPRGSIGYGREFANLITGSYPGADHEDLMAMVDAVAARAYADPRNLFIGGGSGGGVLTLNAIGRAPGKFRAAVALRPVTDWTNQVTTADNSPFFLQQWMGAPPWDEPERYRARSPFFLAGKIITPTLLITGEADFRTPIAQTEMMFGALKQRGVETMMIRLPDANHGMGRPSQWLQSILAPIEWFNRHRLK